MESTGQRAKKGGRRATSPGRVRPANASDRDAAARLFLAQRTPDVDQVDDQQTSPATDPADSAASPDAPPTSAPFTPAGPIVEPPREVADVEHDVASILRTGHYAIHLLVRRKRHPGVLLDVDRVDRAALKSAAGIGPRVARFERRWSWLSIALLALGTAADLVNPALEDAGSHLPPAEDTVEGTSTVTA